MTQEPRYRRIAEELRHAITGHAYGPGGKLPSEGALAEQYEVSRGTIRQALMLLRQDGLVTSRRGTRRVVLDDAPVQDFAQMQSFARWARSIGETPEGRVVRQGWHRRRRRRTAAPAHRRRRAGCCGWCVSGCCRAGRRCWSGRRIRRRSGAIVENLARTRCR